MHAIDIDRIAVIGAGKMGPKPVLIRPCSKTTSQRQLVAPWMAS